MNRHADPPDGTGNNLDVDPGEPIGELADLRDEPSPTFRSAVLDGVNRRTLAAQSLQVSWWGLTNLLLEYLQLLLRALGVKEDTDKEG